MDILEKGNENKPTLEMMMPKIDFDKLLKELQQKQEKNSPSFDLAVKIYDAVGMLHTIHCRLETQMDKMRNDCDKVTIYHNRLWHRMDGWRDRAKKAERKLKRLDK